MEAKQPHSLETASEYLNNLLLSRGLVRNGKPIEFANPKRSDRGIDGTMIQVINLVHDLVLRRDEEEERRETIANTVTSLRSDSTRLTSIVDRLTTRNEELRTALSQAQAQSKAAKSAASVSDHTVRSLREDLARLRTSVGHVRASCANEVRKRDVQIAKLKSHLTAAQRGTRGGVVGASVTITPGTATGGGGARTGSNGLVASGGSSGSLVGGGSNPALALAQETADQLRTLCQSLSTDNDRLITLVRSTSSVLRQLQGLADPDPVLAPTTSSGEGESRELWQSLETETDEVLASLRQLLTSPNFVSIDEVVVRDNQIERLRAGWDGMAARWREAMDLMDGWHARLVAGGGVVRLEELQRGIGLGVGMSEQAAVRARKRVVFGDEDGKDGEDVEMETGDDLPQIEVTEPEPSGPTMTVEQKLRAAKREARDAVVASQTEQKVKMDDSKAVGSKSGVTCGSTTLGGIPATTGQRRRRPSDSTDSGPRSPSKRSHRDVHRPSKPGPDRNGPPSGPKPDRRQADENVENEKPGSDPDRTNKTDKTKSSGRSRRRKSTLSPEELQALLAGIQ